MNDARKDAPDFLGALAARTLDADNLELGASLQPRLGSRFEDAAGRIEAGPRDLEIVEEEIEVPMPSMRRTTLPARVPQMTNALEEPAPKGIEPPAEQPVARAPRLEPHTIPARTRPDALETESRETRRTGHTGLLEPQAVTRTPPTDRRAESSSGPRTPRGSLVTEPTRPRESSDLETRDEPATTSPRVVEHVLKRHTERETRTVSLAPEARGSRVENPGRIEPLFMPEREPVFEAAPPPIERTVRVTIGRLEVRVQAPPAPPPARARPSAKVMSLEEYIKQRDGGMR